MPSFGWLEFIVLMQTVMPALVFIPGLQSYRIVTRMAAYGLPLMAWIWAILTSSRIAGGRKYPVATCMAVVAGWLVVSLAHPNCNTFNSALCAVGLTIGVFCPVFWAPAAVKDSRQLQRVIVVLFLCNAASAVIGLGQVYRPNTFMPSKVAIFEANRDVENSYTVEAANGLKFVRPPGLTDNPGGAAVGGATSCLIGLAFAVSPIAWWKRAGSLLLALIGLTIIFYSQVRSLLITLILGIGIWTVLLILRREVKKLAILATCVGILVLCATGWILRSGGTVIFDRFLALFEDKATTVYYNNRGFFIENAIMYEIPTYPLGAGPGRIGMASAYFGNLLTPPDRIPLYAETQIEFWILDGGLPVFLLYPLALILAFYSAWKIALRSPNPSLAYWGGVVAVYGLFIAISCFGGVPFMTPTGVQFWVVFGALYGAQECSRVEMAKGGGREGFEAFGT